jgi:SWI/SNF-related matrix-associated actin-dependent regulator 1 of chromatin subfamily A
VFAHHKEVVAKLAEALAEYNPVMITGDTPVASRQDVVDKFQTDDRCRVFIGNIQAAGVGLTLTASSTVIFAELDWVPGNITQAEDRCHRIGQRDSVNVYHCVVDGSFDQHLAQTIVDKQDIIDAATNAMWEPKAETKKPRPATRAISPEWIEQAAERVTEDDAALMLSGLQMIAGADGDYAQCKNDIGFSKVDVRIGHQLSEQGMLTRKQAVIAARLVNKYRRQIADEIIINAANFIIKGGEI